MSTTINQPPTCCVVGGALIDVIGIPDRSLISHDSNPGKVHIAYGGVGRNIAEILSLLQMPVSLITAFGGDGWAQDMRAHCIRAGIDLEASINTERSSAVHMAVMQRDRDLSVSVTDINLFKMVSVAHLNAFTHKLDGAKVLVADTNISEESLHYLIRRRKDKINFIDTVSGPTVHKIRELLPLIHTLKINALEAKRLTNRAMETKQEILSTASYIRDQGVKNLFLSLGKRGLYVHSNEFSAFMAAPAVKVVNTNGAGDALGAGIVYAMMKDKSLEECAIAGLRCAALSLQYPGAVNPVIRPEMLISSR